MACSIQAPAARLARVSVPPDLPGSTVHGPQLFCQSCPFATLARPREQALELPSNTSWEGEVNLQTKVTASLHNQGKT